MKNAIILKKAIALLAIVLTIATGCKRTEIPTTPETTPTNPVGGPVNDAAQVTASVSGIVLDETNAPIANAVVTSGTATTTTNTNGMFIFQNISLSKENGNITAVKAGYFKGIRSFKTTAGKNHTVRLQLMQRVLSGTVNAAAGGTITSNGGATIVFPANAFVTSTGAAYTGAVTVYSRWIDPTAANLPFVIPGDLRGVSTTGVESILETYGMVGAELADASGNVLKIATGKTATVSFPIPASLSATAPASIVLWHFDDATARWKENGTATKTGSVYIGQVDKFSFWNVDVPSTNFINLDYTLINATNNTPLVATTTRIKRANGNYGYGTTNNAGFVSGLVPKNEVLVLEVIANSACGTVVYAQNIGPFAVNTSLGNINVAIPAAQFVQFTGTLTTCTGAAVSNGYISLAGTGGYAGFGNTTATGAFSFSILNCSGIIATYNYQGTDVATGQQSSVASGSNATGTVNLGTIAACGTAAVADVYVAGEENGIAKVWKNGVATNLSTLGDSAEANSVFVLGNDVYVAGVSQHKARVWKNGVGTNLTVGEGNALSIYVVGSDVYVAGNDEGTGYNGGDAIVWKNGVATNLTPGTGVSGDASSVFVIGTDVYVAGGYEDSAAGQFEKAVVWKNGIRTLLTTGATFGSARSVFVNGSDVYVAGGYYSTATAQNDRAVVWKNGVPTFLTTGSSAGFALSVYVVGTDVYVAGVEENATTTNNTAKVWKNGVATSLSSGTTDAYAISVFVKATDVYVAGLTDNLNTTTNTGMVWKNGLLTNFFSQTNTATAYSIFVK
jgi:hypothetical protein